MPQKFNFIDIIVIVSYYLFSLFLLLSLLGFFKREFIILGLAAGLLFFLKLFWRKIEFPKNYFYFFVIISILFVGILFIAGSFEGDGIDLWLPWARDIVLQEKMPDFSFSLPSWHTSIVPLVPLFFAGAFSLFGYGNLIIAFLPFFFAAAAAFLLFQWLSEKGVKKRYLIFGILLLLTNPLFLQYAGQPMQEPFILFFFTAFFYYLEKAQRTNSRFYFLLLFLSAVLAVFSKITGLFLLLPLAWVFIKNWQCKKSYLYLFLFLPLLIWLVRNCFIYDNPFYPFLDRIFKGNYHSLLLIVQTFERTFLTPGLTFWNDISTKLIPLFLFFCPAGALSFYGFWKERKIHYILLVPIFFVVFVLLSSPPYIYDVRFFLPFLVLFIVYAMIGLEKINSRIFLSFIFFFNLWGLFSTKLSLSQSQNFLPIERALSGFRWLAQFVYDYRLIMALLLAIFFFFLISSYRQSAKYLILLLISSYLVKTQGFHLGSWLNIWLPILSLIFIILIWRLILKLKEEMFFKAVVGYVVVLLIINSWGLPGAYFLVHRQFSFPNFVEAYGVQPEAAQEIEKLEGENRDFYVYASSANYFGWYHNFKAVSVREHAFHVVTNLKFNDNLNPSEIHSLFKENNIKYVIDNHYYPQLVFFFDKIKSRLDLFELVFQKEGVYLWQVK